MVTGRERAFISPQAIPQFRGFWRGPRSAYLKTFLSGGICHCLLLPGEADSSAYLSMVVASAKVEEDV